MYTMTSQIYMDRDKMDNQLDQKRADDSCSNRIRSLI